ncbi:uncharacterized protein F13E9.13, mitochondrial isoform X4 [Coccinella septempunctata]|uniref:uncharacterized protein F13E9.13, mitochondrial isoform X4 n=1 Tax=Coccinella septempunctata TaxID=41139 RepID=UPI001D0724C5|nr:uncharacterized protein F13E9.13, mitochondrial isoform X4 [Coccinella septempunctata]
MLMRYQDGILIENMHDVPYIKHEKFQPETVACLSRVCAEIKRIIPATLPCGLQVLAGGNKEALAIAKACSLNFIRAEGFVFGHIADEGYIDADAGEIMRYRKYIEADNVKVFTDIKKKHSSHSITADVSLVETANAAHFFLSDGVILTGTSTGSPADASDLAELRNHCNLPILIGSGVTADNLKRYKSANAFIVGSYFKRGGVWCNDLDENRIKSLYNHERGKK